MEENKFNVKAFAISLGGVMAILALVISVWSRSTGFAIDFWNLYNDLHPSPYGIQMPDPQTWKHIVGTIIDTVYAFLDGLIIGGIWSSLYNKLLPKPTTSVEETTEEENSDSN